MIKDYTKGENGRRAVALLTSENDRLSPAEHARVRNYLIMLLVISNAPRCGPLINLNVRHITEAETRVVNNQHILHVSIKLNNNEQ